MSNYRRQEFDFINRTAEIIKQYDSFQINKKDKYEVTLLLNCIVGLLILPKEHWYEQLPTDIISEKEWGIKAEHIASIKGGETKNVKDITRHLRNSIAHYRFTAFENSNDEISKINFKDFDNNHNQTFEATIPISNLRNFINKFSAFMVAKMKDEE